MVNKTNRKYAADVLDDFMGRVIAMAPEFSRALSESIGKRIDAQSIAENAAALLTEMVPEQAAKTRHEWAGEQARICYIARREDYVRSQRNESIVRDYLRGERITLLSRRYQLTERRVLQIVKQRG